MVAGDTEETRLEPGLSQGGEAEEKPVRERLRDAAISSHRESKSSEVVQTDEMNCSATTAVKAKVNDRGRSAQKNSLDGQNVAGTPPTLSAVAHTWENSEDVGESSLGNGPSDKRGGGTVTEDEEGDSVQTNRASPLSDDDAVMRESAVSPRKKRSAEEMDVGRDPKQVATEEAQARKRRSMEEGRPSVDEILGSAEASQEVNGHASKKDPAAEIPPSPSTNGSNPAILNNSARESSLKDAVVGPTEDPAIVSQKLFAKSGFAAMSSLASPFGFSGRESKDKPLSPPAIASPFALSATLNEDSKPAIIPFGQASDSKLHSISSSLASEFPSVTILPPAAAPSGFASLSGGSAFGGNISAFGNALGTGGFAGSKLSSFASAVGDFKVPAPATGSKLSSFTAAAGDLGPGSMNKSKPFGGTDDVEEDGEEGGGDCEDKGVERVAEERTEEKPVDEEVQKILFQEGERPSL